jgi:hemoglobin/transferrin/lactoferrin receptor protein
MRLNIAWACCLLSCLLFNQTILAQQNKDSIASGKELDEVVVSYNKWEQKLNEIPNRITKINLKQTKLRNPQTMADLLGTTGEIFIQKSQQGGGSPMIRGFATNRVLIVVDGVRMNNAIYRSGNIQNVISLDPMALEDAEVIFGPGSILYGSDAIGGVMDFHTLSPKFSTGKKLLATGNASVRYSSANQEKTIHADLNVAGKKLSFLNSFTYSDFGDLKMGKNGGQAGYLRPQYVQRVGNVDSVFTNSDPRVQRFTGYQQRNFISKLRYKPTENWDLQYGFHYSTTSNIPRYDRLIEYASGTLRFAEWNYGPQEWMMHHLQIQHKAKGGLYDQARLTLSIQDYEESRIDRRRANNNRRTQTETVLASAINLDLQKQLNGKQDLFYGAEFVYNKVGSTGINQNIANGTTTKVATRYPDGSTWNSIAAYVSYKNKLKENLTLSAGLRYNHNALKASFDTTFFKFPFTKASLDAGNFTMSTGLVYRMSKEWQMSGVVSSGFRMPNIDDIGKVFESAPGVVVVPNVNLKSEYAWNAEWGVQYNKKQAFSFYFNFFYSWLNNALTRRPYQFNGQSNIMYDGTLSRVEAIQNVASAKVWGIQTGWQLKLAPSFNWQTKLNWIKGEETDDTKNEQVPLRHAPPFFGSTQLNYEQKGLTLQMLLDYNSEIANKDLAPSEQAKTAIYAVDANGKPFAPSWYTLNVKAAYRITEKISAQLGWENITNQRYRPYSSGVVAAGSNFIASMRVSF